MIYAITMTPNEKGCRVVDLLKEGSSKPGERAMAMFNDLAIALATAIFLNALEHKKLIMSAEDKTAMAKLVKVEV